MRMRFALRLHLAQGTLFPLPHVWLDFFVYTYKFTFYYRIITTRVSFLYVPTTSDCRCSAMTFNCWWSPTTPDDIRWHPEPLFANITWLTFGNQSEGSKDNQTHLLNNVSYTDDQWCSLQVNFLKCRLFQHFLIQFLIMSSQNTLLPASTLSPHHHCEHASLDQPHLISSLQNTATLTPLYWGSLGFLSNHFEAQWQSNLLLIFHVSSTNCRCSQLSQLLSGGWIPQFLEILQ